jgi:hypothetical protein
MAILNNNPLIGASGQSKGYRIERSLRFNSADSAYLNRTPASAGNRKTFTWSGWVKRSALGATNTLFGSGTSGTDYCFLYFQNDEKLIFYNYSSAGVFPIRSNNLYRDLSAWYHVVLAVDTTQATSSNRVKLYVNNEQITSFSEATYPDQNDDLVINSTSAHAVGAFLTGSPSSYFNGYLADINFIDGSALTPSSFGETDADTGVWKPKAYSGSYGTNGFYLKFADNSGTTSTTLGKDSSGNSNNWTPNGFLLTPPKDNDSLVDSPTQYGTDTGAGGEVRGNYCTLSPVYALNVTYNTPANGNLEVALSNNSASYGTFSFTTGKWYWEITVSAAVTSGYVGVMDSTFIKTDNSWGSQARTYIDSGNKYGGSSSAYGASWTNGDVIGVAVDMDAGTIVFYKNGSSQGTAFSDLAGKEWKPMVYATTTTYTLNFGQRPFAYTAPSGFKALCTTNLPTPTIGATSTTQADNYFNVVARTFTGASASITGLGFNPDFLWFKRRNSAASHSLFDKVRGNTKRLLSNGDNSELTTTSDELTSFDSDGFTVGADTGSISVNGANGDTGVVWCWRGNGSGSSNTSGTITSTVSANTTAGFSIVTYTGNNTLAQSVGHGLGVAPSMIIVKSRSNTTNWLVWHSTISINSTLLLNTTGAEITGLTGIWGSATPTSTTFGLNRLDTDNNRNGQTYVAYCFAPVAGYSAFGSYTGNGSTDGPFIYTGFRPKFVLIKPSSAADNWQVEDAARSPFNVVNDQLWPNLSDAEQVDSATRQTDFLSNGFKIRGTNTGVNGNGTTYIYAAFAEVPFRYSLAR